MEHSGQNFFFNVGKTESSPTLCGLSDLAID